MAKGRGRGTPAARGGRSSPARPSGRGARRESPKGPSGGGPVAEAPGADPGPPRTFRLGAVPGATPGTWIDRWRERMPGLELVLVPLQVAGQREALTGGEVDAAIVRLPIERDELHVIPLYDEVPVVVFDAESHLAAADELSATDLEGEVRIVPADDVLPGVRLPGALPAAFPAPDNTGDAIAIAATGVGFVVVPMSLARLHHRRDVTSRPLKDAEASSVALAWVAERTTADVEAFVGIVRGRTARSSRA